MSEYLYSADVVRLTLVVGVIVSMLFYERLQLTTGGAIVPAYLSLGLHAPVTVATTVACGWLTYVIVNHVIARRRILYGRRKFEVEVLVGLVAVGLVFLARMATTGLTDLALLVGTIGFLVPGIIAHDMFRQGVPKTMAAVGATTVILGLFLFVYTSLLPLTGIDVRAQPHLASVLGFDRRLLLPAIIASVLIGMVLFERLGLRSGGFITAAYIAFMLPRYLDLAYVAVCALLTWLVVVKVLMPRLLLFGRRKLSTMILFGSLITWTAEVAITHWWDGIYQPGRGLTVMTLILPALIANDAQRQGWERTSWGVALNTAGVYAAMNLIGGILLLTGVMAPTAPGAGG